MRKVLMRKRKYSYRDIYRILLLALCHYLSFYVYFAVVLGIHYVMAHKTFDVFNADNNALSWSIWYGAIAAPAVNAFLHAFYAEKGSPWMRAVMWWHTFLIILLVPIAAIISR